MSVLMDNQTHHVAHKSRKELELESTINSKNSPKINRLKVAMIALLSSALMLSSCNKSDYEKASKDFIKAEKELKKAKKNLDKAEKRYEDAVEEYDDAKEEVKEESDKL